MAKSKNGGSRAYIRGRIGSDVYSVGKNGKGEKQQVVRSLAEQVSNPRTQGQMFGRMIMSTVMQAVAGLSQIIDHSFDGIAKGQPNISEFIRTNYALVKADAQANPASPSAFPLVAYQQKGAVAGKYVVSKGNAVVPAAVFVDEEMISIGLTAGTLTVGGLKAALGLSADGYLTHIVMRANGDVEFFRAQLTTTLADATTIDAANVTSLFTTSGNVTPTVALNANSIEISVSNSDATCTYGVIVSDKIDGSWEHNNCTLTGTVDTTKGADVILPTYPTGAENFLNGGDL
ncbi:MAG: hypothetical protein J6W05_04375 [Prevotella sp.]|nr:hypothetical protein [Prevotella sp.]